MEPLSNPPIVNTSSTVKDYKLIGTGEIKKKSVEGDKAIYQQKVSYNSRNYTLTVKMDANATQDQVNSAFDRAREKTAFIAVTCRLGKDDKGDKVGVKSIKITNNIVEVTGKDNTTKRFETDEIMSQMKEKLAKVESKISDPTVAKEKPNVSDNDRKQQWQLKKDKLSEGLKSWPTTSKEQVVKMPAQRVAEEKTKQANDTVNDEVHLEITVDSEDPKKPENKENADITKLNKKIVKLEAKREALYKKIQDLHAKPNNIINTTALKSAIVILNRMNKKYDDLKLELNVLIREQAKETSKSIGKDIDKSDHDPSLAAGLEAFLEGESTAVGEPENERLIDTPVPEGGEQLVNTLKGLGLDEELNDVDLGEITEPTTQPGVTNVDREGILKFLKELEGEEFDIKNLKSEYEKIGKELGVELKVKIPTGIISDLRAMRLRDDLIRELRNF